MDWSNAYLVIVLGMIHLTFLSPFKDIMNEKKAPPALDKEKTMIRRQADAPTYRTVLIAASVGVLIGLLLKR